MMKITWSPLSFDFLRNLTKDFSLVMQNSTKIPPPTLSSQEPGQAAPLAGGTGLKWGSIGLLLFSNDAAALLRPLSGRQGGRADFARRVSSSFFSFTFSPSNPSTSYFLKFVLCYYKYHKAIRVSQSSLSLIRFPSFSSCIYTGLAFNLQAWAST